MATLKLKSGDDLQVRFTITDPDSVAIDLTGGTIKFKIAKNVNTTDTLAVYVGTYTSFTAPTTGIQTETIADSETATWTAGNYQYQVRFIDSSNVVRSEDVATCIIEPNLLDDV